MIAERTEAKKAKNFARADQIREQLLRAGHHSGRHQGRRPLEKEIDLEDPHQSRPRGRPEKARRAYPRHHADPHRVQLLLRIDGAARPHLRPEEPGYCYARYDNPTNAALEELVASLEGGHGALACASGMAAIHMAILTALADRRKSMVAANALYGATVRLLMNVLEPGRGCPFRGYAAISTPCAPRCGSTSRAAS